MKIRHHTGREVTVNGHSANVVLDQSTAATDQWRIFRSVLDTSISKISQSYFSIPRFGTTPACRERAYCYELYHQLREFLPKNFPYTLHGEIDKAGHRKIMQHFGKRKRPNPDFIVHVPGESGKDANLVVVEVKRSEVDARLVKEDIWKIHKFMKKVDYQHGIMLFFGHQCPKDISHLGAIEALWHRTVGEAPIVGKNGRFD